MSTNYWEGKLVRLRAVEPSDWETHFEWNQDADTWRGLDRIHFPASREYARQWAEGASRKGPDGHNFHLEIESLTGQLVGSIATFDTNERNGTFYYSIAVAPQHQRKGYASEAIKLLLRYFFEELRYNKATVRVYSFNRPSIRLHESVGFKQEGRLRQMIYTGGQYHDEIMLGITREEFEAPEGK
ncbi:MAG TPA: GNAT family N-acetyltransferase [Chloroflexia bacterium]|nr:GNAT family N-acetyltransferase [Chloroflexia bacterium]